MSARGTALTAAAALTVLGSPVLLAQQTGDLTVDVAPCIRLDSDLARYDCYERLVEEALAQRRAQGLGAPAAAAARPAAPAERPAAPAATRAAPAASARTPAARPAERDGDGAAEPDEIVAIVTEIEEFAPNRVRITLDNGDIWRQTQGKRYLLRVGDEVRIYATRWGDDRRLTGQSRGFIQVERVR